MRKLFGVIIVLLAIVIAVLGIFLPRTHLQWIIIITNFFDIMIPILAVGALIAYISKSCCCGCHHKKECSE